MAQIKFIVDKLNEPPLYKDLTLVSFDEKTPQELLQLLNDVFAALDSRQARDLRDEPPDISVQRMAAFIQLLNYRGDTVDPARLRAGDRDLIYPILTYILTDFPKLQKRAYLGRFLTEVSVPENFFQDPDIVEVYQQHKELQNEFKEVHKAVERLRGEGKNPEEMQRQLQQMEADKDGLNQKIAKLQKQLKATPDFDELYQICVPLRKELEEAKNIQESIRKQQHDLSVAEQKYLASKQKLHEVQRSADQGQPKDLLARLEDERKRVAYLVNEKMPKEIEEKGKRLDSIQRIMQVQVSEAYINSMQDSVRKLTREIAALVEKKSKHVDPNEDKLASFRQQAKLVANKKRAVLDRLDDLLQLKKQLEREVLDREKQREAMPGMPRVLKGAEFKKYADQLRTKSAQYKKMKAELAELTAERGILDRTEQVLRSRDQNLQGFLRDLEAKRGVAGYLETQENLEHVSAAKQEVDETKGKTLEEVSEIVGRINEAIKERKSKLAPQIKELRTVRQAFQEIEQEYNDKKQMYDGVAAGLDGERTKLESEVGGLREECGRDESTFHFLNSLALIVEVAKDRVSEEQKRQSDARAARGSSLKEQYQGRIAQLEKESKGLRDKQKQIKETHEPSLQQLAMFSDLKKLLHMKLMLYKQMSDPLGGMHGGLGGPAYGGGPGYGGGPMMGGGPAYGGGGGPAYGGGGGANVMTFDNY